MRTTDGGADAAVAAIRAMSSSDGGDPATDAAVATDSWIATTPSPKRCAVARATSVASPASRAPTTSRLTAWPARIDIENPGGTMNAASAVPSSTAARATASVGTSVTVAMPACSSPPITSWRRTRARSPPSRSATT